MSIVGVAPKCYNYNHLKSHHLNEGDKMVRIQLELKIHRFAKKK
jgi:hypothetical protein